MAIGHRIKAARKRASMSQREFAKAVGVSYGLVGQWESHLKKPGRETLRKVAEVTLSSMEWFLGERDDSIVDVRITDPGELALLRHFRRLSDRQRQNLLELIGISADIIREMQKQPEPAE